MCLSRCCRASSRSRGWCSSRVTGPDLLWLQRVYYYTCRSVTCTKIQQKYYLWSDFSPAVRCLFQPLSWQQPYVPVLSREMLDFLMAPTAFLMGCHISHFEEVAAVSTNSCRRLVEGGLLEHRRVFVIMNRSHCTYITHVSFVYRRQRSYSWSTLMTASFSHHVLKPLTFLRFLCLLPRALYQGKRL